MLNVSNALYPCVVRGQIFTYDIDTSSKHIRGALAIVVTAEILTAVTSVILEFTGYSARFRYNRFLSYWNTRYSSFFRTARNEMHGLGQKPCALHLAPPSQLCAFRAGENPIKWKRQRKSYGRILTKLLSTRPLLRSWPRYHDRLPPASLPFRPAKR